MTQQKALGPTLGSGGGHNKIIWLTWFGCGNTGIWGNHGCWKNYHSRSLFVVEAVPSKTFVNAHAVTLGVSGMPSAHTAASPLLFITDWNLSHCKLLFLGLGLGEPCTQSHSVLTCLWSRFC